MIMKINEKQPFSLALQAKKCIITILVITQQLRGSSFRSKIIEIQTFGYGSII